MGVLSDGLTNGSLNCCSLRVQFSPFPKIELNQLCESPMKCLIEHDKVQLMYIITFVTIALFFYFLFSSAVKAHQFFSEESWGTFKQIFNNYMFEASKVF